jgi:hypothetical protein
MKRRHLLFAMVDGGGNVPAELGVVRRLVERGHTATVLAEDSVLEEAARPALKPLQVTSGRDLWHRYLLAS